MEAWEDFLIFLEKLGLEHGPRGVKDGVLGAGGEGILQ